MSKKIIWNKKENNKKIIEHLQESHESQDCPTGYLLENRLSLSLTDSSDSSSVISSVEFVTDKNTKVCVGPANGSFILDAENIKGGLSGNDVVCSWGQPYLNGTYNEDGIFDGTVICVYTRSTMEEPSMDAPPS
jgi:hypothetical protein